MPCPAMATVNPAASGRSPARMATGTSTAPISGTAGWARRTAR